MRYSLERDPHYRGAEAYEYGALRKITLKAIVDTEILWSCTYSLPNGGKMTCGGFSGPYEALAYALARAGKE